MANGRRFNYESPLDRLLNYTIPTMISEERTRQDREVYRDEIKQEREAERIENKRRWDLTNQQNISQNKARLIEAEDDELYKRGMDKLEIVLQERDILKQKSQLEAMDGTTLHPDISELVTSTISGLDTRIKEVDTSMGEFSAEDYSPAELSRIKNQFIVGSSEGAYQVADKIIQDRYSTPWVKTEALRIHNQLKSVNTEIAKMAGIETDEAKARRSELDQEKLGLRTELANLYDQDRPFDPRTYGAQFNTDLETQLKEAGLELKDKNSASGLFSRHSKELKAFRQEYMTGPNASDYTPAQRNDAAQKVIQSIIEKEKVGPRKPPGGADGWENMVPGAGTVGAGYLAWQLTKEPIKKAGKFISDKSVSAARHIKFVTGLPGQDIVKFLDEAAMDTPGKPGTMMKKVESLLDDINELSGEKKTKANKAKMAKLNQELDDQVGKVKNRFRKLGVSKNMKDADLEKLIRNPNKWRLAGVKKHMIKLRPKAAGAIRGWGVFSAAQKIGDALGDPTEGVATGLGAAGAAKGINSLIKKKGSKWTYNKLAPFIGKSLAKRVAGGAAAGIWTGPGAVVTTTAGAALTIWDIYNFLKEEE